MSCADRGDSKRFGIGPTSFEHAPAIGARGEDERSELLGVMAPYLDALA